MAAKRITLTAVFQKLVRSFFLSLIVFFPVVWVCALIFIFSIFVVSLITEAETIKMLIRTLWSPTGVGIAYVLAFVGTLLHQCGWITFKNK